MNTAIQPALPCFNRGGKRPGAGRKPRGERAGVAHRTRPPLRPYLPLHITVRLRPELPSLRTRAARAALLRAFHRGRERFGFRLVHYSIQHRHLHLIVEAADRLALARGLKGLLVRCARQLNHLWARSGRLLDDRPHEHILASPREVRAALRYVLGNAQHHGIRLDGGLDPFASGWWFDGWREAIGPSGLEGLARPVVPASTWLLRSGWRRHGLLSLHDLPSPAPPGRRQRA